MGAAVILIVVVVLVSVNAQPIPNPQNNNQNFVPGVFISADTLKDLQQKAQQNQNPPITNQGVQPITNTGRSVLVSPNSQNDGSAYQPNSSPQNTPQSQPTVLASQPILTQPTVPNQAAVLTPAQPQVVVAQPVVANSPSNQAIVVSQPNQAYLVQQPGNNQPVYLSQPSTGSQFVSQPNQQVVLPNGQIAQVVVANGQPLANGQTFFNNGQPFVNNGQPFVNNGQPLLVSTNPGNNQFTLIQGARQNPVQNPSTGVQYAMVPVGQNNNIAPNTNPPNGNSYYVVPSSTNQVYAVSG